MLDIQDTILCYAYSFGVENPTSDTTSTVLGSFSAVLGSSLLTKGKKTLPSGGDGLQSPQRQRHNLSEKDSVAERLT